MTPLDNKGLGNVEEELSSMASSFCASVGVVSGGDASFSFCCSFEVPGFQNFPPPADLAFVAFKIFDGIVREVGQMNSQESCAMK